MLLGKYTRTFVPRFPGIPEMLYFPPPSASGNITSRGFPGTSGQTFWYISLKAMKYLYNVTFLKISFYRKPRRIFWTVLTSHIYWRAKYCATLYWPLIAGTANVILTAEVFGIERTSLWNNDGHLTVRATWFMTSRESAGVTLFLEFRIDFSSVFTSKM